MLTWPQTNNWPIEGENNIYETTTAKIQKVDNLPPVALEDASLSTWIQPMEGTGDIYYDKGSLFGLLLDILIRDGSDNARSLDDVMRQLYGATFKQGRGFGGNDWWPEVTRAAGGRSLMPMVRSPWTLL